MSKQFPPPPVYPSKRELLKWTRDILRYYSLRPRKKLSQSFVIDPKLIREIINWVKVFKPRVVYEIGAGIGTLTYYLCCSGSWRVIAIEVDERYAPVLKGIRGNVNADLEVVICDGLKEPFFRSYVDTVVSNVPYHISSKLLLALYRSDVKRMVLTLQNEVAERLNAKPSTKDYGRLTIITRYLMKCKLSNIYPPRSFFPAPRVSSRVVVLIRKHTYDEIAGRLEDLTRCLFSERNKFAIKVVRKCVKTVDEEVIKMLGVKRVRDLTLEDLLLLMKYI